MAIGKCIVVAHAAEKSALGRVHGRVADLASFYGPLGEPTLATRELPELAALVAVISFTGGESRVPDLSVFGGGLPRLLRDPPRLLRASDEDLRTLLGPGAVVAIGPGHVRLLTSPGPPTSGYHATRDGLSVWSTHAVAAAFTATGAATLNTDVIPEFMAAQFVGGAAG
jgi:hypothetical protein